MTRQRLGQHFLHSASWLDRIARTLPLQPGETWIEIGAGHGEMTSRLQGDGRRVIAIEMDPPLAAGLRKRAAAEWIGVEVMESDALAVDFGDLGGSQFRVYGNLPYYITSPLIRRVFQAAGSVRSLHIVIQKEVAERIVATPGHRAYGFLSTLCQFYSRPKIVFSIPPGAFRPPPRVSSALLSTCKCLERGRTWESRMTRNFSSSFSDALGKSGRHCATICALSSSPPRSRPRCGSLASIPAHVPRNCHSRRLLDCTQRSIFDIPLNR
jgi:16S rRNA (adenine1518-N6/adenine1519-N6)-dimethyltransferase